MLQRVDDAVNAEDGLYLGTTDPRVVFEDPAVDVVETDVVTA